jgi:hypothetical protein
VKKVKDLGLPPGWESRISEIVHTHKMMWEPWLETANNYQELRQFLKKRGYRGLPAGGTPILNGLAASKEVHGKQSTGKKKVMLQRKS